MPMLRRAAICMPLRTAVGKFGGALSTLTPGDLGAEILRALMTRSAIDPARVDDVIFAQGYGNAEAPAIGHWAWLAAGLPLDVPGYQLDRRCGSGLQAIINAAMMVQSGATDVVVAGGCESMSNVEHYTVDLRRGVRAGNVTLHDRLTRGRLMSQPVERFGVISGMIETAENLARDYGISREAADAYALRSHSRAHAAWEAGKFDAQLVPLLVPQKRGEPVRFARDEGIRADATMESLGALKPLEGGVVTAGNASQQNDAAAACLVVAEEKVAELSLTPLLWFTGHWPGARDRAPVRAQRVGLGRYRPCRTQRSLCAPSARGAQRLGLGGGRQPDGYAQRQWFGHIARPPDWRDGWTHPCRYGA